MGSQPPNSLLKAESERTRVHVSILQGHTHHLNLPSCNDVHL